MKIMIIYFIKYRNLRIIIRNRELNQKIQIKSMKNQILIKDKYKKIKLNQIKINKHYKQKKMKKNNIIMKLKILFTKIKLIS